MPNWVTDNTPENTNPTSNIHQPPINNDIIDLSGEDIEMNPTIPSNTSNGNTVNGHTQPQGLQQQVGQFTPSTILLSPDTPVPSPPYTMNTNNQNHQNQDQNQPSSSSNPPQIQTSLPQQHSHQLSRSGNATPLANSPAVASSDLPNGAQHAQNGTRRVASSSSLQNNLWPQIARPQSQQGVTSSSTSTPTNANTSYSNPVATSSNVTQPIANLTNVHTFPTKTGQPAHIQLAPEYAQKLHRVKMNTGAVQDMTTLDILRRYSPYLTIQELERMIKDPKALASLGQTLSVNMTNANTSNTQHARKTSQPIQILPRAQHSQQQQQQPHQHQQHQQSQQPQHPQQAGPSRPTSFVSSAGYTHVPQDNPAQIQQSINNLQNQARPDSRQGIRNNVKSGNTPIQSPTIPAGTSNPPQANPPHPEVQVIQQEFANDLHAVEQTMGQGWEQLRAAANSAFAKMGTAFNAKSTPHSEATITRLGNQLAEEQKKSQLFQSSVLRLSESESRVRSELLEVNQRVQNEIDAKNTLQQSNNDLKIQLANRVSEIESEQAKTQAESTKLIELTNALKIQTEKVASLESNIANLKTTHNTEIDKLKKELSEALSKPPPSSQSTFGVSLSTTSPKSPKSPNDLATHNAKLQSLLRAKNTKFTELEEKKAKDIAELQSQISMEQETNDVKIQSLENRIQEIRKQKDQLVEEKTHLVAEKDKLEQEKDQLVKEKDQLVKEKDQLVKEKDQLETVNEQDQLDKEQKDDQTKIVLEKIVVWGESLQKRLGRKNLESSPTIASDTTSNGDLPKKTLIERANTLIKDMASLAEHMLNNDKDRKDKMKKLQGQNELLKVQLTAAQSSNVSTGSSSSETELEEMKSAFKKIISWGENIQVLMGKTLVPDEEESKPLDIADKFQKSMHKVFEEIQSKNQDQTQTQTQSGNEEKIKKLEEKVKSLERDLQANLDALFSKTSQFDDANNLLGETKLKLVETQNKLKVKEDELIITGDELKARGNELKAKQEEFKVKEEEFKVKEGDTKAKEEESKEKIKSLQSTIDELRAEHELDIGSSEKDKLVEEKDKLIKEKDNLEKEKDNLIKEKENLTKEKNNIVNEKDNLMKERDDLKKEKDNLVNEKNNLTIEKDNATKEKDNLMKEKESMKIRLSEQILMIDNLQGELETAKNSLQNAETSMTEGMNKQFEDREKYVESEKELKEVKEHRNKLKEEIRTLQAEIQTLKNPKTRVEDGDDIEIISGSGLNTNGSINRKRPISQVLTPDRHNSDSPSSTPLRKPSTLFQSVKQSPISQPTPLSTKKKTETPLFFENEEEEESQTPSQSIQRPKKRKKLVIDDDEDEMENTPGPASKAPSIAPSARDSPVLNYKPVAKDWITKNYHLTTKKNGNKTWCKLCFVEEKKTVSPEKAKYFKVEDIDPLPIGISESELLQHVSSHGANLRRLKDKRVREGKEPASP